MKNNVTIQDLANALGMSRNTVSKALNGQHVPMKTRNAVINAAIQMGYKSYKLVAGSERGNLLQKRIIILSSRYLMNMNYYIHVLRGIEEALDDEDVELSQFNITNRESFIKFKQYLSNNKVDGILCIEFLDESYIVELVEIGIPLVFIDFPVCDFPQTGSYDIILPESRDAVTSMCVQQIQKNHCKSVGFVGDYQHCISFYERYSAMKEALFLTGLNYNPQQSILYSDSKSYSQEALQEAVQSLYSLPDFFVCANDFIALNLIRALKTLKINVPKEIKIIGFDNIPESKNSIPPLSTFNVNKRELGSQTISFLLNRINNPAKPRLVVHIASKSIIRETT